MAQGNLGHDGPRRAAHRVSGTLRTSGAVDEEGSTVLEGVSACALLLLALVLGGGTRSDLFTDLLIQFAAIPVLLLALYRQSSGLRNLPRDWLLLVAMLASLPLLFLIPIPSAVFAWLPGRDGIAAMQSTHGIAIPWARPLSLNPTATLAALRALLPALALALLVPQLDHAWRQRLLYLVILAGVFSVPLGLAQVNGGAPSPLRFYVPTNVHDAVGLFANRNHFAALLVSGLALVGVFLVDELARARSSSDYGRLRLVIWAMLAAVLIFGLALSKSRAGVGLGVVAMGACAWLAWRQLGARALRWIAIGAGLVLLLGFQVGFLWMVERAQQLFAGDHRWQIMGASLDLARDFAWIGVGPGAFPAAYAAYEPIAIVGPKIVNHAHNDWLEWWLEIGLLLPLIAIVFARWLFARSREVLGTIVRFAPASGTAPVKDSHAAQSYIQGAWLVIFLAILHAAFDYQLRTTTDLCVFAICCGCLVPRPGRIPVRPPRSSPQLVAVRIESVADGQSA